MSELGPKKRLQGFFFKKKILTIILLATVLTNSVRNLILQGTSTKRLRHS